MPGGEGVCWAVPHMEVSWNGDSLKSSMFKGFPMINHQFWGAFILGSLRSMCTINATYVDLEMEEKWPRLVEQIGHHIIMGLNKGAGWSDLLWKSYSSIPNTPLFRMNFPMCVGWNPSLTHPRFTQEIPSKTSNKMCLISSSNSEITTFEGYELCE